MKGQVWSMDLAVSLLVFLSVAAAFIFAWGYVSSEAHRSSIVMDMEETALDLSDGLVRFPGQPDDWNQGNVVSIGLADSENTISSSKMDSLGSMDYDMAKEIMGAGSYNFYLELSDGGNFSTAGMPPDGVATAMSVERYVMRDGRAARLKLVLWL